jgi:hypothetical protein
MVLTGGLQTAGFACSATRELIHHLGEFARTRKPRPLPILFMSDFDFHAIQIFLNCKFGSKSMAWGSAIQSCPSLEWVGPTRQDIEAGREHVAKTITDAAAADNPMWTDEQKEARRVAELKGLLSSDKIYFKNSTETRVNAIDRSMAAGWISIGMLDHCPLLKQELEKLLRIGRGVRLVTLRKLQPTDEHRNFDSLAYPVSKTPWECMTPLSEKFARAVERPSLNMSTIFRRCSRTRNTELLTPNQAHYQPYLLPSARAHSLNAFKLRGEWKRYHWSTLEARVLFRWRAWAGDDEGGVR